MSHSAGCLAAMRSSSRSGRRARPFSHLAHTQTAFTLIEMLVVIAIIAVLAGLLFPVFLTARGKAREAACLSNLRQIGMSVSIYLQDYDDFYPYAVDPADLYTPWIWSGYPAFKVLIPYITPIQDALQPYVKSQELFHCPADTGFTIEDFTDIPLDATPTSYQKFGTSYYYRTELAVVHATESTLSYPAEVNVIFDGAGKWHGSVFPPVQRYDVVFADGHTKNLSRSQLDNLWALPLSR